MPITFPINPVDGQLHEMGGLVYIYDGADDSWIAQTSIPSSVAANAAVTDLYFGGIAFDANTGDVTVTRNDLFSDFANIDGRYLPLAGGTMTGPIVLANTAPTANNEAVSKSFMETFVANAISFATANVIASDTFTTSAALANGNIDFTRNDGGTYSVDIYTDLDARFVNVDGDTMTGPLVLQSDLTVAGNTTVTNITASGTATFDGDVYTNQELFSNNVTVSGDTTVNNLTATGNTSVNNLTATGNTAVTNFVANGTSTFEGDVYTNQELFSNNVTVSGDTTVNNLTATGNTSVNNLTATGNTAVTNFVANGTSTFEGDVYTEQNLFANNVTVSGDTVVNNLTATGNTVVETFTANGQATFTSNVTIKETLTTNNMIATGNTVVQNFYANSATVETLTANNGTVETLTANNGTVETLVSNNATVETLTANNTTTETLTSNTATVETLTANNGTVETLTANNTTTETLNVNGTTTFSNTVVFNSNTIFNGTLTTNAVDIAMGDLTDADTTGVMTGQYMAWNGTEFVPTTPTSGSDTYVTASAFDANTRVLTLTMSDASTLTSTIPLQSIPPETLTAMSIAGNILTYTDEAGANTSVDLSLYLDDTNLARLTAGSVAANGMATFTRDDATTFDVDFSALFDDTNLSRITSGSVVGNTLTLTRDDSSTINIAMPPSVSETVTSISLTGNTISYVDEGGATTNLDLSSFLDDTNLARIVSGSVVGNNITMVRDDSTTFDIDVSSIVGSADTYPASASIDPAGVITTTLNDGNTYTVDISPWVYAQTLNQHSDVDTLTTPPANGEVLTWDATAVSWVPASLPSGTTDTVIIGLTFDSNTNTLSASVSDGGTYSVVIPSSNVTSLGSLSNVDSEVDDQPSNREFLTWSPIANSFVLDASSLAWIGDVNTTGLANGQVLQWDENSGFSGEWVPTTLPAGGGTDTVINALTFDSNTNVLTAGVSDGNNYSVTLPAGGGLSTITELSYTQPYNPTGPYATYDVPSSVFSTYSQGSGGVVTNATQQASVGIPIGTLEPSLRYNFVGITGGENVTLTSDIAAEFAATSGYTDFLVEIQNNASSAPYGSVQFNPAEFTIINNGGVFPDMSVVDKNFYFRVYQTPVAEVEGKFNVEFLGDSEGGTATGGGSTGAQSLSDLTDVTGTDFLTQPQYSNGKFRGITLSAVPSANTFAPTWGNEVPIGVGIYTANGATGYLGAASFEIETNDLTFYEGRTFVIDYLTSGDTQANSDISWALSETPDGTHGGGTKFVANTLHYYSGESDIVSNGIRLTPKPHWPNLLYLYDENNAGRSSAIHILKGALVAGGASIPDGTEYGQLLWWNNADWTTSAGPSTGFEFDGWTGRITTPQVSYLYDSANDYSGAFAQISLHEQFAKVNASADITLTITDTHPSIVKRTIVELDISNGSTVTISGQVLLDGVAGGTITGDGTHIVELVSRGTTVTGVHWRNQKYNQVAGWTLLGTTVVDSSSMTVTPYANINALFADATEGMIVARIGTDYISSCIPAAAVTAFPASFSLHKGGSLLGEVVFSNGLSTLYTINMGAADEIKIFYR